MSRCQGIRNRRDGWLIDRKTALFPRRARGRRTKRRDVLHDINDQCHRSHWLAGAKPGDPSLSSLARLLNPIREPPGHISARTHRPRAGRYQRLTRLSVLDDPLWPCCRHHPQPRRLLSPLPKNLQKPHSREGRQLQHSVENRPAPAVH